MHTSFAPDQIDEDYIENICEDLRCALINVLDNPGEQDEYDRAVDEMRHIGATLDAMMPDED